MIRTKSMFSRNYCPNNMSVTNKISSNKRIQRILKKRDLTHKDVSILEQRFIQEIDTLKNDLQKIKE